MRSTLLTLTVALASIRSTLAQMSQDIAIQTQITAGVDTQGTISAAAINDGTFDQYRVYLAATPPGWGTGPICTLVNSSSTKDSTISVNIPASVGPSGDFYSLSYVLINTSPNATNDATESGFGYSNTFDLEGATGNWSQYELSGHTVGNADDIPCTAFDCARQCSQKFYPANVGNDDSSYNSTYNCILKCPGVVPDEEDDASGAAATSGGSITSTATQTSTASTGSRISTASGSATGSATKTTGSASNSATGSATGSASAASASSSGAAMGSHVNMEMVIAAGALGVVGLAVL